MFFVFPSPGLHSFKWRNIAVRIVVTAFYSSSCLDQDTAKGPFSLWVKLPLVYHAQWRLLSAPCNTKHQAGKLWILIFIVSGLTLREIEHGSTVPVAEALSSTRPLFGLRTARAICTLLHYTIRHIHHNAKMKICILWWLSILQNFRFEGPAVFTKNQMFLITFHFTGLPSLIFSLSLLHCTASKEEILLQRMIAAGGHWSTLQLHRYFIPISGRVDKASATKTVDTGSITGRIKSKTIKVGIHSLPVWRSTTKRDSVKPPPCVVDRWANGSLTRRLKGAIAVFWSRQLCK